MPRHSVCLVHLPMGLRCHGGTSHLQQSSPPQDQDRGTATGVVAVVVPVVCIPRAKITLRSDLVLLLTLAGIRMEDLVCIDDDIVVSCLGVLPTTRTTAAAAAASSSSHTSFHRSTDSTHQKLRRLTLVDHNRLHPCLIWHRT